MLVKITTTYNPARDIGYLLGKHPDRLQTFNVSSGKVHVFFPEATNERATAALLLDINPVDLVRNYKNRFNSFALQQYVNDRPFVASSLMSNAIAKVYSSALNGRCKGREELVKTPIPLEAQISVLPVIGGDNVINKLFEPLGYEVESSRHVLDDMFEYWGESRYYTVKIRKVTTLKKLLSHLYVLIPVFDNDKHYWIPEDEISKLLDKGKDWLSAHPEKILITRRYLGNIKKLTNKALVRLQENSEEEENEINDKKEIEIENSINKSEPLNLTRYNIVLEKLKELDVKSVIDIGCGEGKFLIKLLKDSQFEKIAGTDVSFRSLKIAMRRLHYEEMAPKQKERINLFHSSLIYVDDRLRNFESAVLMEVIEHIDPDRLESLSKVLFEVIKPAKVIITTPNIEYNIMYPVLKEGRYRHSDHRFEWSRKEFRDWCEYNARRNKYRVNFFPIGNEKNEIGSPTQMAVFEL